MSSMLYYRNGGVIENEEARALGLAEQYLSATRRGVHGGPGGGAGTVWSFGAEAREVGYWPDRQVWVNTGPDSRGQNVWCGWTAQPGPEELKRKRLYEGAAVRLADGHEWTFPRVGRLPKALGFDEHGERRLYVEARFEPALQAYRDLAALVSRADARDEGEWCADTARIASVFLGLNYLVGEREVVALRLVTFEVLGDIAGALLG